MDPLTDLTTIKLSRIRSPWTSGRRCVYSMLCKVHPVLLFNHPIPTHKEKTDHNTEDVFFVLLGWEAENEGGLNWTRWLCYARAGCGTSMTIGRAVILGRPLTHRGSEANRTWFWKDSSVHSGAGASMLVWAEILIPAGREKTEN